jgi:hypothetical protein
MMKGKWPFGLGRNGSDRDAFAEIARQHGEQDNGPVSLKTYCKQLVHALLFTWPMLARPLATALTDKRSKQWAGFALQLSV